MVHNAKRRALAPGQSARLRQKWEGNTFFAQHQKGKNPQTAPEHGEGQREGARRGGKRRAGAGGGRYAPVGATAPMQLDCPLVHIII